MSDAENQPQDQPVPISVPSPAQVATASPAPAAQPAAKTYTDFCLPVTIITKIDLSKLVSDFERVDDEMTTAGVRAKTGTAQSGTVVLSDTLKDFLVENQLRPTTSNDRQSLLKELRKLKDKVPILHMTFASPADTDSQQRLVKWLRDSVHKQAVISVGLQPSLVAGVYLRTPNKTRDLSLRGALKGQHDTLVTQLEALRAGR